MHKSKSLTGLDATQDENNFIILCVEKSFYIPNAVRFNGWIYAERKDVISALESNFVDIDNFSAVVDSTMELMIMDTHIQLHSIKQNLCGF